MNHSILTSNDYSVFNFSAVAEKGSIHIKKSFVSIVIIHKQANQTNIQPRPENRSMYKSRYQTSYTDLIVKIPKTKLAASATAEKTVGLRLCRNIVKVNIKKRFCRNIQVNILV